MSRRLPSAARVDRGTKARAAGRAAEAAAALWLMAKGWRILGYRLKTPQAEIDILARKGGVLAVVEVKARPTMALALAAVSPFQAERLRRAGADFGPAPRPFILGRTSGHGGARPRPLSAPYFGHLTTQA